MRNLADQHSTNVSGVDRYSIRRPACSKWAISLVVLVGSLMLVLITQARAGAFWASFGGFPDEPAHYVGGLLIHDYMSHVMRQSPLAFVQDYHARLPYFALGVWPPLFYFIEGFWMFLFGVSRGSVLWLMAFSSAGLATLLYTAMRPRFGFLMGISGAAMFLLVPVVQWSNCLVMADMTCSLFAFLTVLFFVRFCERETWLDAIGMGLFGGLALLTKNSTFFVLLIPPLVILGTASWNLLRKPAFWVGSALVIIIYMPWLYVSRSVLLLGIHGLEMPGVWAIHRHYVRALWDQAFYLAPLGVLGVACVLIGALRSQRKVDALRASMIAILPACSIGVFVARVPVQPRLLILPYVALVFLTAEFLTSVLPRRKWSALVMAIFLGIFAVLNWMHFRYPPPNDLQPAVVFIKGHDGPTPGSVLVSSSREGPWIAEFAEMEGTRPSRTVLRPTKMLGEEDWNGTNWRSYYATSAELQGFFERTPVKYCILAKDADRRYPHDEMLRDLMTANPQRWRLIYQQKSRRRGYDVYENTAWSPDSEKVVYKEANRIVNQILNASQ